MLHVTSQRTQRYGDARRLKPGGLVGGGGFGEGWAWLTRHSQAAPSSASFARVSSAREADGPLTRQGGPLGREEAIRPLLAEVEELRRWNLESLENL